ncbi:MAG: alpha-L-glutamate ligase [Acidobacteriota bacterium]|nr:alpha-L-glutamate ligase [Acidobacteriota bacterium]
MVKIYVLHENEAWVAPLTRALDDLRLDYEYWFLNEGLVPLHEAPPEGIFYNRIGASAHLRGNPHAPELTGLVLDWLERHERRVVNSGRALAMELSKTTQYAALEALDIPTPRTIPAVGRNFILQAAQTFLPKPVILKHNRGGKGHSVNRFDSLEEIVAYLDGPDYEAPVDGVWLVQEFIQSPRPYILRCEFVGGRFFYAMQVDTGEGFALCPAEVCPLRTGRNKYRITDELDGDPVIQRYEQFLEYNNIDIASIELIRDADGKLYTYDVNTNTNYNEQAETDAGLTQTGMQAVARYLGDTLGAVKPCPQARVA